jgi:hypothetical protein
MDLGDLSLAVLRGLAGDGPGVCKPGSNAGAVSCSGGGARLYATTGERLHCEAASTIVRTGGLFDTP